MSKAEVDALLQQQQKQMFKQLGKALSGEEEQPSLDPLSRQLILNPRETLSVFKDTLFEEWNQQFAAHEARKNELQIVAAKTAKQRPDIAGSDKATQLLMKFYAMTDSDKSDRERFETALKEFDAFMEDAGQGTAEERVKKHKQTSLGAGAGNQAQQGQSMVSEEQILGDELKERQQRWLQNTRPNF